jgi:hypothetical protein
MLPKIDVPVYDMTLLSTGKKIKFRPFTVKEEKLFLMASEADDLKSMIDCIKQIINNCVITKIDVDNLPIFDIEQLFLNLRAKSVGEIVNLRYKCNNTVKDEESGEEKSCNHVIDIDVNISDIIPKKLPTINNKIEITENLGIVLSYPKFKSFENFSEEDAENIMDTLMSCIDYIYDKEEIYYAKDSTKEELLEFLESLQTKDIRKFQDFFNNLPKLEKQIHFKCSKCEYEEDLMVEGLENFFV